MTPFLAQPDRDPATPIALPAGGAREEAPFTGTPDARSGATPLFAHARHRTGALMSLLQLHWFIRLRWAFVGAALAVLAIERFVTPDATRPGALALPVLVLAIVNLIWMGIEDVLTRKFQTPQAVDEERTIRHSLLFANAQVTLDLTLLTVILRYTGGVENPMAIFYLFHMAIGALLLKSWHAVLQGVWAMLLYTGLALGEWSGWIRPHWDFLPQFPSPGFYARGEYVVALLAVMACGIFATLYFTLHITGRLDEREAQLRGAYDALRKSEVAILDIQHRRARFMQTAAHQLKGPLASVQTLLGLLIDGIVPQEAIRSTYERMAQRCREGAQQVAELLTLARVQQADPRRHPLSVTDVGQSVEDICRRYAVQAEGKGIALACSAPRGQTLYARIDRLDLADCVGNLLENAIKYTNAPGQVRVLVLRGAELADALPRLIPSWDAHAPGNERPPIPLDVPADSVVVCVSDNGIGIEPEALSEAEDPAGKGSIFDAFRRGNNVLAANIPGTGLGLAIVREVVEQAGGRIFVYSRVGEGTTFIVVLPASPGDAIQETPLPEPVVRNTRVSVTVIKPAAQPEAPSSRGSPQPRSRAEPLAPVTGLV